MIKILDIDGFKHLSSSSEHNFDHIPKYYNFRKNCTYIHLQVTNWEKDKMFFDFLEIHINSMPMVKAMIEHQIGIRPTQKTFHIIIRQDDDNPELYGKETYSIGNVKPKKIKEYISWGKETYTWG